MLIRSDRQRTEDLDHWAELRQLDRAHASMLGPKIARATVELHRFLSLGPAYVGVSWGKDSVVVADIAMRSGINVPLVWARPPRGIAVPGCNETRDAFLAIHPDADYREVPVKAVRTDGILRLVEGIEKISETVGISRYVSGVRNDESRDRLHRFQMFGHASANTCAPLSLWKGDDVFAYLEMFGLPVHPHYGMTIGGRMDRNRLRVSIIGPMRRGRAAGRDKDDHDWRYYPDLVSDIQGWG